MAVLKAVSSKAPIEGVIDYVTKEEKTESKLLSGKNCDPEVAIEQMRMIKKLWFKETGRTYAHYVQSFHPAEPITPELGHKIACEFAIRCKNFNNFQVLIATHRDRDHIHTHFIVNSVDFQTGKKYQCSPQDLQAMKDLSDEICREHGLSVTVKGKGFHGEKSRLSTYTKEQEWFLKQAEEGKQNSYVVAAAERIAEVRKSAVSREDFAEKMAEYGYAVEWREKNVLYTDLERKEQGYKQCRIGGNKLTQYYGEDAGYGLDDMDLTFRRNAEQAEAQRVRTEQTGHGPVIAISESEIRRLQAWRQQMLEEEENERKKKEAEQKQKLQRKQGTPVMPQPVFDEEDEKDDGGLEF